jgi:hypothetical protein
VHFYKGILAKYMNLMTFQRNPLIIKAKFQFSVGWMFDHRTKNTVDIEPRTAREKSDAIDGANVPAFSLLKYCN